MRNSLEFSRPTRLSRREPAVLPPCEALEARCLLSALAATFQVTQDWGSGFQASISISNTQMVSVDNWRLEFEYDALITSIWDARIVSHTGTLYVVEGAGWNNNLSAGGSISFGFLGSGGSSSVEPSNYVLNGAPLGTVLPTISIGDASTQVPVAGSALLDFPVSLSSASKTPVSVRYTTVDGSAVAGSNYSATSGTLTFAPGEIAKVISVPILSTGTAPGTETFQVLLSDPSGASVNAGRAIGTIKPAPSPGSEDVLFAVTSDWGTGFNGYITVKNTTSSSWTSWTLSFDFAGKITSIWDAHVSSRAGDHYEIENAAYDGSVEPGGSVTFGFTGTRSGPSVVPTNTSVRGGGPIILPPMGESDSAWTTPGTPVSIPVLVNDSGPNGFPLMVDSVSPGLHGAVEVSPDGHSVTYTPESGFTGRDTFTYTLGDGTGLTATAQVTVNVSQITWPAHVFAPYVDMTMNQAPDLASTAQSLGVKYFNLAFVVADSANRPSWGGYSSYEVNNSDFDLSLKSQISALRGVGGDVAVSFGGANGMELAQALTDVKALQSAYQSVINAYRLSRIDFDIEGGAVADHASIDRRSQAVAALQQAAAASGKPLQVWFTLPVLPSGLTQDGLYVLRSALDYGVEISGVNVMAMDYGDYAAPNPSGQMGDYAIQAAASTFNQLKGLYGASRTDAQLWGMIGITPMIGQNDAPSEVFTQTDAQKLLAFAEQNGLGELSMWSLNRDMQNANGRVNDADSTSSGILQKPYEFSLILQAIPS
ncbi:MAG TPA: cellulose binding domain-containing protein [Isosphaeraceae bacterium]|nr:cellulose binding domain-containing protein [Isosphaeraceae bacterium]